MSFPSALDPEVLTTHAPVREKLSVWILQDGPGILDVTLHVPLDPAAPPEQSVIDLFAPDRTLDLRYRVEMNLAAERRVLAERIHAMYRRHAVREALIASPLVNVPLDRLRDAFAPIAAQGASIFRRLFHPEHFDSHGDEDNAALQEALCSVLSRELTLVIKSPEPLFPWAFLYDGDSFDELSQVTLDFGRFWGFRHQIQEEVDHVSRHVRIHAPPSIIAAVCPQADQRGEHRQGPLGQLSEDRITWIQSALALVDKLGELDADCLYFFGHAGQNDPPTPTTSYLKVDGVELTVERVARGSGLRVTKPLVLAFLNGCGTGPLNSWNRDSIAGFLCFAGSHRFACVTSFAEVPAGFASALAQCFWADFLAGRMLGEALRDARRSLFAHYGNPLGLLYAVLGRVEARITLTERL